MRAFTILVSFCMVGAALSSLILNYSIPGATLGFLLGCLMVLLTSEVSA